MEPQTPEKFSQGSSEVAPATWADFIFEPGIDFDEAITRIEAFGNYAATVITPPDCPLTHHFPDKLYAREIFMPAGSIVVSRVHRFDNPFFIMRGKVTVLSENEGRVIYEAPHHGITRPGTRRLLLVHEDTVWVTVHPNPENIRDVETLENTLTFLKPNPYKGGPWRLEQ